jgi:hypothetical protein
MLAWAEKLQHGSTRSNPKVSAAEYPRDLDSPPVASALQSTAPEILSKAKCSLTDSRSTIYNHLLYGNDTPRARLLDLNWVGS